MVHEQAACKNWKINFEKDDTRWSGHVERMDNIKTRHTMRTTTNTT